MKLLRLIALIFLALSFTSMADALVSETKSLDGVNITYDYTSGRSYHVKFEKQGISYRYLTGSKPAKWWGPFPYKAFEVQSNLFMTSWFEEGYGDYVTLLINFDNKLLYGSAIISGEEVHFHGAKIVKIQGK
jgi:hypothetical protein